MATTIAATVTTLNTVGHDDTRRSLFLVTTRTLGAGLAATFCCALYHRVRLHRALAATRREMA